MARQRHSSSPACSLGAINNYHRRRCRLIEWEKKKDHAFVISFQLIDRYKIHEERGRNWTMDGWRSTSRRRRRRMTSLQSHSWSINQFSIVM